MRGSYVACQCNDQGPVRGVKKITAMESVLSNPPGYLRIFRNRHSAFIVYAGSVSDVTRILDRVQQGDDNAAEEPLPLVYDELRRIAAVRMGQQPPGQTLQATALVHEAWLRLGGSESGG